MKKMKMLALISTMVMMIGSLTACRGVVLDSMTAEEIVDLAADYGIEVTIGEDIIIEIETVTEDEAEVLDEVEDGAEDEAVVEDGAEAEDAESTETEPVKTPSPKTDPKNTESPKTESTKTESTKTETTKTESPKTESPKTESPKTESPKTESPKTESPKSEPAQTAQPAPEPAQPTPTPTPAHEHSWKEHTATKQVWVPNIVVIDDYEIQNVEVGRLYSCNCGFQTTDGSVIDEHGINHVLNGEMDNYGIQTIYEQQQVKVGSHQEDHGHYENSSYVDYYYCDCGATK